MTNIEKKIKFFKENLDLFDDDMDKYKYLLDQAKNAKPFPEEFRLDSFKNSLHKAIKTLDMSKHINLKKHIPHADIWLHLSNHAVGVIPFNDNSLTRIGTPTKLFEFMASGCQVVCPNLPPMMRYDFKGINFFTPGDVNELANTIINAIRNISRDDILYNQKKIKSDYNWDNISFRLINLYNRLLS